MLFIGKRPDELERGNTTFVVSVLVPPAQAEANGTEGLARGIPDREVAGHMPVVQVVVVGARVKALPTIAPGDLEDPRLGVTTTWPIATRPYRVARQGHALPLEVVADPGIRRRAALCDLGLRVGPEIGHIFWRLTIAARDCNNPPFVNVSAALARQLRDDPVQGLHVAKRKLSRIRHGARHAAGECPEELERANSKVIVSVVVLPSQAEADEAEGPARGSS